MLTLHQLKRRGRALANTFFLCSYQSSVVYVLISLICFLCVEEEETADHLLVHCLKTRLPWDLFLAIVGVNWVFPLSVRETLLSWGGGSFVGKKRKKSLDNLSLYFLDHFA